MGVNRLVDENPIFGKYETLKLPSFEFLHFETFKFWDIEIIHFETLHFEKFRQNFLTRPLVFSPVGCAQEAAIQEGLLDTQPSSQEDTGIECVGRRHI